MNRVHDGRTTKTAVLDYEDPLLIQAGVRRFVAETFFADDVDPSASLLDQGIIDSTGVLELVGYIESTYGIRVADEELLPENLDSLNNLTAFIVRKRSRRQ